MELSIGTIVIIVLSMSMLIFGMILLRNIFGAAGGAIDLTEDQLNDEIKDLFGENKRVTVYPSSGEIEVKQGEPNAFGVGIKNLNRGDSGGGNEFSYEVIVTDTGNCGESETELLGWIVTGRTDSFTISPGQFDSGKVRVEVPETSSLCTFRYRINVMNGNDPYDTDSMDITVKG